MIAPARRAADRPEDRKRRAGRDAAGAGDDDDRDRRAHIVRQQIGERGGAQRKVDEIAGETVREALHRSTRALGLLHRLDDLAVTRIASDALGADFKRAGLVDGSGEDRCARGLLDRQGFAGDARLIDERVSGNHRAVNWYSAAGIYEHRVADGK